MFEIYKKSILSIACICRVNEFAAAFIDVLKLDKNGSVWLIDGGTFKEITYPNPWYDNGIQIQT